MEKKSFYLYLFLVLLSSFFLSLNRDRQEKIQGLNLKPMGFLLSNFHSLERDPKCELERKETEILHLNNQIQHLKDAVKAIHIHPLLQPQDIIAAKIIYRPPSFWNSVAWINAGEETNQEIGKQIIQKNSPVIFGKSVVGVVEFVGNRQSKIRLITDPRLKLVVSSEKPGEEQNLKLSRGEIHGSTKPSWRKRGTYLQGLGFNEGSPSPKIQVGDHLVTTGMDGIFPPGFQAGIVNSIHPLKEGDTDYFIEGEASLNNLEDLKIVFILPPWSSPIEKD